MNQTLDLPFSIASASPEVQQRYIELLDKGNSPLFAEMLALRCAPGARTDREYFADRGKLGDQFVSEKVCDFYVSEARKHGYEPNPNDVYDSAVARFPGDPRAFISPSGGRGQAADALEAQGYEVSNRLGDGLVSVRSRPGEAAPIETPHLAPDLIDEMIEARIQANPDLARADRRELVEAVVHEHGYSDRTITGEIPDGVELDPSQASFSVPAI